jgi:hypothetical protein
MPVPGRPRSDLGTLLLYNKYNSSLYMGEFVAFNRML